MPRGRFGRVLVLAEPGEKGIREGGISFHCVIKEFMGLAQCMLKNLLEELQSDGAWLCCGITWPSGAGGRSLRL